MSKRVEVSGTKRVTFRLASGGRVEHFFDPDDFTKVRIIHISAERVTGSKPQLLCMHT